MLAAENPPSGMKVQLNNEMIDENIKNQLKEQALMERKYLVAIKNDPGSIKNLYWWAELEDLEVQLISHVSKGEKFTVDHFDFSRELTNEDKEKLRKIGVFVAYDVPLCLSEDFYLISQMHNEHLKSNELEKMETETA